MAKCGKVESELIISGAGLCSAKVVQRLCQGAANHESRIVDQWFG